MGQDDERAPGHVDAVDGPLVVVPRQHTVARATVRVLADPARAQDVARADFEQLPFDFVARVLFRSFCLLFDNGHGVKTPSARVTPGDVYARVPNCLTMRR